MSMSDIADEKMVGKYRAVVYWEEHEPESPREWENLGTMVCQHRDYRLGDVQAEEWTDPGEENMAIIIPLGLIDHSGISMYAGGGDHPHDPGGWDSGTVGIIYVTKDRLIEEYGADTPENRKTAEKVLRSEIEVYDRYLRGEWYGWYIEGPVKQDRKWKVQSDGPWDAMAPDTYITDIIESVGGYFDEKEAMADAMGEAKFYNNKEQA